MAARDILILPDKRLRLVSKPVAKIDAATKKLVEDMFETMYDAPGIGLAAIQIGEPRRIVTMDLAKKDEPKEPQVFINPEVIGGVRREEHPRGGLPLDPGILRGGRAAGCGQGSLPRSRRQAARDRGGGLAGDLHPARDRSPQRRAVHRSHLQAQARPRHQEIHQGGEAGQASDKKRGGLSMPLRLIFMGTPDFSVPTLLELAGQGHDIAAVYTRAAKPGGRRGLELVPSPVEREARRLGLAVHTPASLKSADAQAAFAAHQADAAIVVAYGLILPKPILDAPSLGCFNLHASLSAALARRRADQPRHHGGRRRDRRHRDEDGRGSRHRRYGDDRTPGHRRRHDRGRVARRAVAARRRPDGACPRRAGARHLAIQAAAGRRRDLCGEDRQGRDADRLGQAVARGARPHPRAVAVSRRLVRDGGRPGQGAAHHQRRGQRRARHGAGRSSHHRLRRRRDPHRRVAEGRRAARCAPRSSCAARPFARASR